MSDFIIIPSYKSKENPNVRYSAPAMIVDAGSQEQAVKIAQDSALGRFTEWSFHVATYFPKKNFGAVAKKNERNPASKSQKGKLITGHNFSRPLRRGLRRLGENGKVVDGCKNKGAIKMW